MKMAALRLRSIFKITALSIGAVFGIWVAAIILLYSLIDFEQARKENVPRGLYHGWICLWTFCNPFKAIDPADTNFKPDSFRFEDYATDSHLAYAISHVLGRGMDRDQVERLLVGSGGAKAIPNTNGTLVHYLYPNKADIMTRGKFSVGVYYPDAVHVDRVTVHGIDVTFNEGGHSQ